MNDCYLVASKHDGLGGVREVGVPCDGCAPHNKHFLYVLPLTMEVVRAIRRAPWDGRGGRKTYDGWFVSKNPGCKWPGTNIRPRTDEHNGPRALDPNELTLVRAPVERRSIARATPRRKRGPCHGLLAAHLVTIAETIAELADEARDPRNPFRQMARAAMKWHIWRWTADGFDTTQNLVRFDALKNCCHHLSASNAARGIWTAAGEKPSGKLLRHEHAVPTNEVVKVLLAGPRDAPSVEDTLRRLCHAVVVTKDEDARFRRAGLQSKMPPGWDGQDPWARYRTIGLLADLEPPTCPRCTPRVTLPVDEIMA